MKMAEDHADAATKQQHEAAKKHAEETKKRLGEEREAREKASKERAKAAGDVKPTPTQEEADMAASGVYLSEHEDDGSGPDPNVPQTKDSKQSEAKPAAKGGYATRASTAA
jgi:TRAP-type C4-dicarboxylate transport system substrate-binding protein